MPWMRQPPQKELEDSNPRSRISNRSQYSSTTPLLTGCREMVKMKITRLLSIVSWSIVDLKLSKKIKLWAICIVTDSSFYKSFRQIVFYNLCHMQQYLCYSNTQLAGGSLKGYHLLSQGWECFFSTNLWPLSILSKCHELVASHRLRARLEQSECVEVRGSGGNRVNIGPKGRRLS